MMNKILAIFIGFPLSFLFIIYRTKIKDFTGSIGFAEKYFGAGGTYTLFLFIGIAMFIVSLMVATGTFYSTIQSFLSPLGIF